MKEKRQFPLFQSHLDLAHLYWEDLLTQEQWAIDATCGRGYDTLALAKFTKHIIGIDLQQDAIDSTSKLLKENKIDDSSIYLFCQSHATFPALCQNVPIHLIVYNLGYLPKGDKQLTTLVSTTLESLTQALCLLQKGGAISLTCYPGHPEGFLEQEALSTFCQTLSPALWNVCFHKWENRKECPTLFLIQKRY